MTTTPPKPPRKALSASEKALRREYAFRISERIFASPYAESILNAQDRTRTFERIARRAVQFTEIFLEVSGEAS